MKDYNHEKWLKTRKGKLVELLNDIKYPNKLCSAQPNIDNLSKALQIISEGTKYEKEILEILEMCNHDFLK